ncbi:hypothetical protein ASPCADRAFT_208365 [Aspergillus carbonarius ITEM 5010]|uniref:Uncharacterized protein n=1 Tax=Aspergillus carbonarius (strain ITEM 5010) TaxID=602072 RepID=A0A1R3RJP4_ASPC5|nr:hypothetical protein ASPCADRAFT_208365 [Aspergillus carbonarius ITEM 5010]
MGSLTPIHSKPSHSKALRLPLSTASSLLLYKAQLYLLDQSYQLHIQHRLSSCLVFGTAASALTDLTKLTLILPAPSAVNHAATTAQWILKTRGFRYTTATRCRHTLKLQLPDTVHPR